MRCRIATPADAPRLVEIYAPYVADTAVSFATTAPTEEDFLHKIDSPYPFLVCEEAGRIVGYAYAGQYRVREAYRWGTELSIYVEDAAQGRGVGRLLLLRLLAILKALGYQSAYSCVTLPNEKSIGLHTSLGFEQIGLFENAGYKLGRWRSVAWLRLPLNDFPNPPAEPLPIRQLSQDALAALLNDD